MNNEYPNEYPQGAQNDYPASQGFNPAPPVVDASAQQPYYQPNPNYQVPPNNGYPNQQPYNPPAGYYNYNQPGYYAAPVPQDKPAAVWKVFAILGLIFGIIGLVFCWVPAANIFFIVQSIFAIVFSALGKKSRSGVATAGLVISIIGTVLGFIFAVIYESAFSYSSYYYGF